MKYADWLEKVWRVVDIRWEQLDEQQRALGIPCDPTFLADLGIEPGTFEEEKVQEAVASVYRALKDIENLGMILEIQPMYFRLVDSGPRQLGRRLAPLLEPYCKQQLQERQVQFLHKLAALTVATDATEETAGSVPYVKVRQVSIAEVYAELGWPWLSVIDPDMLSIIHGLKEASLIDTSYIKGELRCSPTFVGLVYIDG